MKMCSVAVVSCFLSFTPHSKGVKYIKSFLSHIRFLRGLLESSPQGSLLAASILSFLTQVLFPLFHILDLLLFLKCYFV